MYLHEFFKIMCLIVYYIACITIFNFILIMAAVIAIYIELCKSYLHILNPGLPSLKGPFVSIVINAIHV